MATFSQIREHVILDDEGKQDLFITLDQMAFGNFETTHPMIVVDEQGFYPTDWAYRQICAKFGIPAPYMSSCPVRLQIPHFEHWQRQLLQSRVNTLNLNQLLRVKRNSLRAFLSGRYSILNNHDLLQYVSPIFSDHDNLTLSLQDTTFELGYLATPDFQVQGQNIRLYVVLLNSEVGARSISVGWKVFCNEGYLFMQEHDIFTHRHLGLVPEQIQEAIKNILSGTQAAKTMVETRITAAASELLEELQFVKLERMIGKKLLNELIAQIDKPKDQVSRWDIVLALLSYSRNLDNPEACYTIQKLTGSVLLKGRQ